MEPAALQRDGPLIGDGKVNNRSEHKGRQLSPSSPLLVGFTYPYGETDAGDSRFESE